MGNSSTPETLKSLESLYVKGNFDDSIKSLIAQKSSFEAGPFHYNLGTLYAKKGDYAVARFHFEKAIKAGFIGDEVVNNLTFSTKSLQLEKIESEGLFLDTYYSVLFSPLSVTFLVAGFYLLIVLILKKLKTISARSTVVFLMIGILSLGIKYFLNQELKEAILLKKSVAKEGPSAIFESHQDLPAGIKLIVTKPREGWYFIKYPSHFSGWIQGSDLGIL